MICGTARTDETSGTGGTSETGGTCGKDSTGGRIEKAGSASQSQRMHRAGYVGAIVRQVGQEERGENCEF